MKDYVHWGRALRLLYRVSHWHFFITLNLLGNMREFFFFLIDFLKVDISKQPVVSTAHRLHLEYDALTPIKKRAPWV